MEVARLKRIEPRWMVRTRKWFWKWKYAFLAVFAIYITWWAVCLPDTLFDKPYSYVLYDRDGNLLGATTAADGQWRFPPNDHVPDKFKKSLLLYEDKDFDDHMGVSFSAMARAAWLNTKHWEVKSGGSTITMQLMRISRGNQSRNLWQKFVEITWATRAEWRYDKDEILAMYCSHAPMGGNVVGLEAASWRYFGRPPKNLTWAESATLAVLPNSPGLIHPGRNRDALKEKRDELLQRLHEEGEFDEQELELALLEPLPEKPHPIPHVAPHLMGKVIGGRHNGGVFHSTLSVEVQQQVDEIVQLHHERLALNEVHNLAVLVTDVETGQVVAYVGNCDDPEGNHGGQVDVIRARRSSGSILKPFLYASMIDDGALSPQQMIKDVPTYFPGYSPKNYNKKYDGVVPADRALARSLNVPSIQMLMKYGTPKLLYRLRSMGFSTLERSAEHYGLALILGGAEVTLWDLVASYRQMAWAASQGEDNLPMMQVFKEADIKRRATFSPLASWYTLNAMTEVKRPEEDLNWEMFQSSQRIAWKTGTSFGFRDAWAVGVTPKYVVGVWVGNADGEGRPGIIGRQAAAPVLFDVFSALEPSQWFSKPQGDGHGVDVCSWSGMLAGADCPNTKPMALPHGGQDIGVCSYHQAVFVDTLTGKRVLRDCFPESSLVKRNMVVLSPVVEQFFRYRDARYESVPHVHPDCAEYLDVEYMEMIYPKNVSTITLPRKYSGKQEPLLFEVAHRDPAALLHWHLDEQYLGQTTTIHQMTCLPDTGSHVLKVIDEEGNVLSRGFKVETIEGSK